MVQSCSVRDCNSSFYPGSDIVYHPFPKQTDQRSLWLSIVPLKTKFNENARICSLHFTNDNYDRVTRRIKPTAVPFFYENPTRDPLSLSHESDEAFLPTEPTKLEKVITRSNSTPFKSSKSKIDKINPVVRLTDIKTKYKDPHTPTARKKTSGVVKIGPIIKTSTRFSRTTRTIKSVRSDDGKIYKVDSDDDNGIGSDTDVDTVERKVSASQNRQRASTQKSYYSAVAVVSTDSDEEYNPIPSDPLLTPMKKRKSSNSSSGSLDTSVKVMNKLKKSNERRNEVKRQKTNSSRPRRANAVQKDSVTNGGDTDGPKLPNVTVEDTDDEMDIEKKIKASTAEVPLKAVVCARARAGDANKPPYLDKKELKLRLVTNIEDGPMYEIVSEDGTDCDETRVKQHAELPKRKLDDQYWKSRLRHIVHNARFCGACLGPDQDLNLLSDDFEILINGNTHSKKLGDIADVVFKDTDNLLANSQICNNCTTHLIQSYIFIENTREASKMLHYHLDELYNKTCYIKNNVLNKAEQKDIHNVVFSLNNTDERQIEVNISNENQEKAKIHDFKRLVPTDYECMECETTVSTEKEWEEHQTTHKKDNTCKICNITCKSPDILSKHYALHFKSKCRICNGLVQDGGLLTHLKKCHGNMIRLCKICNVVFYSKVALDAHNDLWHLSVLNAKCLTCLRSYTEQELVKHKCRFKCPECIEVPCVHHKYLMSYREQMLNLSIRAKCPECHFSTVSKDAFISHVVTDHM